MLRSVRSESVFIDIGANIGVFSLIANKNRNIRRIYSFEPSGYSFALLRKNIERNGATVDSYMYAIGAENRSTNLSIFEGHSGRSAISQTGGESVKMINHESLNVIIEQAPCPVIVKIDVEGFELEVLSTLKKSEIFPNIEHIHVEMDVTEGKPDAVKNLLELSNFIEVKRWGDANHWDAYWVKRGKAPLKV